MTARLSVPLFTNQKPSQCGVAVSELAELNLNDFTEGLRNPGHSKARTVFDLFVSLQLEWATTREGMLSHPCLPHKVRGILLNVLPRDTTSELAG